MVGIIFIIIISIGLPFTALIYSLYKKSFIPFLLGILTFVISQILLRIPLLEFLSKNSTGFIMLSVTKPVLFAVAIGLSAGIFEELGRFIAMRFFMKKQDWKSGFIFGAGHGGIEAVLFVGISAVSLLFSPTAIAYSETYFIGGIERFFAIVLHIGLSIIVLQGVVQKRFHYVLL